MGLRKVREIAIESRLLAVYQTAVKILQHTFSPSRYLARCEHAEKGRENPTLRSLHVRSRPLTDWYRRLPSLYRSTVRLDRSPRDSKVQNWTQILPTSPQGVGKGPKWSIQANLTFRMNRLPFCVENSKAVSGRYIGLNNGRRTRAWRPGVLGGTLVARPVPGHDAEEMA